MTIQSPINNAMDQHYNKNEGGTEMVQLVWRRCRSLTWDVTVVSMLADSYLYASSHSARASRWCSWYGDSAGNTTEEIRRTLASSP